MKSNFVDHLLQLLLFPSLILSISFANFSFPSMPINKGSGESITSIKFCGKLGITVNGQVNGFII